MLTEGKTEATFLEGLRKRYRLPNVDIQVLGQVGDPGRIVKEAKRCRTQQDGRPGKDWLIHVVFDRDEHPRFAQACEEARQCGLVLGVSVPCFELWLILLKADQTAYITSDGAQRRCKELHPGYCHDEHPLVETSRIHDQEIADAERRSKQLRDRAMEETFPNPSSSFSDVVRAILEDVAE